MIGKFVNAVRTAASFNRQSSDRFVRLAQRGLHYPANLTTSEIKMLAASVLSQAKPALRDEGDTL
jgi:hypothetical protein